MRTLLGRGFIEHGLGLNYFRELDYDISNFCSDLEKSPCKPPLGFVMVEPLTD